MSSSNLPAPAPTCNWQRPPLKRSEAGAGQQQVGRRSNKLKPIAHRQQLAGSRHDFYFRCTNSVALPPSADAPPGANPAIWPIHRWNGHVSLQFIHFFPPIQTTATRRRVIESPPERLINLGRLRQALLIELPLRDSGHLARPTGSRGRPAGLISYARAHLLFSRRAGPDLGPDDGRVLVTKPTPALPGGRGPAPASSGGPGPGGVWQRETRRGPLYEELERAIERSIGVPIRSGRRPARRT